MKPLLLRAFLFLAAVLSPLAANAAITITRTSSPIFYSDIGQSLDAMYVSYQITNGDAVTYPTVYATISNLTGGIVSLAGNESGFHALGAFAPGQTKTAFFFLKASAGTTIAQTHTISVLNGSPGIGATLAAQSFSFTSVDDSTIKAQANKVTTIVTGPNPPSIGGVVTITVTGQTGTLGAAGIMAFTPAAFSSWRADAFALVGSTITLSGGNTGTYADRLLLPPPASTANTDYTAVYTFKTVNTTLAPTTISPVGYLSSGTQVKHTDTGGFGSFAPVQPPVNTTLLAKTATPTGLPGGGTADYTLRFSNSGAYDVTLDRIVDTLPASPAIPAYMAGTAKFNGVTFADPAISGRVLTWNGVFVIPAGTSRDFTYSVAIPSNRGAYVNSAVGFLEATQIDTTLTTSDNAPAQATVTVASADVAVTKTGPASAGADTTFSYTINYVNNGPDPAANVVLRDTLPAGATFVSASNGGTFSAGVVTWPAIATLANAATGSYTVTIRAPLTGTLVNTVASTADTGDPTPSNNDGSAASARVTTTITPVADVAATLTGPGTVLPNASFTYTATATNIGPSPATSVVVSQTLPVQVTFVSASNGGTFSGGIVTWPAIASLANGADASYTVNVTAPANGTFTSSVASTSTTADPVPANNDGTAAAARVTTTAAGATVSGTVYLDANHNMLQDASEAGTGLTLYAKIVPAAQPSGPALQAVAVNPAIGAYAFSNIVPGLYTLLIDTNASLSDVTPKLPAGWSGTQFPSRTRTPVPVTATDVPGQDFGLINALTFSGRVFSDNGASSGTANDGILNGGESGLAGVALKLTDATGTTVYDTATTDGAGNYSLLVPGTLAGGTQLKVTETNAASYLSTGASLGNSGGTYARATDAVSFLFTPGVTYIGINFGDVAPNTLDTDGQQAGLPGTILFYAHTFTAGSAGSVTFSTANTSTPALAGWTSTLYRDLNANGQLDPGEPAISGQLTVAAGETVALIVKQFIPTNAPLGARNQIALIATFTYTGATPALSAVAARQDITIVGDPTTAGLTLRKEVNKPSALPGETLTYTLTYTNTSSDALRNVVIYDSTPAFTRFLSGANGPLPPDLTGVALSAPSVNQSGALRWTFTGTVRPGGTGTVMFTVRLDQ